MKVTTKKLSDTSVELKVVLDKNDLKEAEEKAITRLVREVKIEGFRKGKAPLDMAKKAINPNELANVSLDIAVRTSVPKAFEEGKSAPLMIPNVEVTKFVPGETVEYTAKAEILPDVKLGNYKKLGVKRETIKVTEKDINEILENIQNAYAEKKVAKKKAEMGDEVVIDFEGSLNGEKFEGGAAKDFTLGLGSKQFIPGFEEGIVGHESGDRFDLELTFPKDYHAEKLAGKKTVFNVLVKQVSFHNREDYIRVHRITPLCTTGLMFVEIVIIPVIIRQNNIQQTVSMAGSFVFRILAKRIAHFPWNPL